MADDTGVPLRDYFDQRLDTQRAYMDQRFADQQRAVEAALAAVKDQTRASFEASEKAIQKAEAAQGSYNQTHNDLIRKAERLAEVTMPREEITTRIDALRGHMDEALKGIAERVEMLRLGESRGQGGSDATARARLQMNWTIGISITVASLVLGAVYFFANR